AVDIAATYGFSINAVTYGFLGGVFGQFLAVFVTIGLAAIPGNNFSLVAVPLFITLFFNSGAMGVFANASGGWKASFIVP
ncbi:PTS transporter subunit IIC, partial [Mesomycoplasma flocculare]